MGFTFTSPESYRYRPGMLFLGVDERGQEVGIETQRHALTVAGSGAGKGAALLIPNAKRWTQNLLVIDPKGEVAAESWEQREALGQTVAVLDPFEVAKVENRHRAYFNPLAEIDGDTSRGRMMISAIADGLIVAHDPRHTEWTEAARLMWAGVIAFVVGDAPPEQRNFAEARRLFMQPQESLYNDAQMMAASDAFGGMVRNAGVMIMTACDSDKGIEKDALNMARRATLWLDEPKIKATLEGQSFTLSDLKHGSLSLYLVLPPDMIASYAGFLRLFVKTALRTMGQELAARPDEKKRQRRCLFMLDEFYSLGKLSDVTQAVGLMRGYGVQLWPFVQNYSQIEELYGQEAMRNYFENSDADIFMGVREDKSCNFVADRIGKLTPAETGFQPVKRRYTPPYIPKTITGKAPIHGMRRSLERFKQQWAASKAAKEESRFTTERGEYDHGMRLVGTHRIPPDEIRELIALEGSGQPARSMIVFTRTGAALNLGLAPHFKRREEWKAPPSPYSAKAQALGAPTMPPEVAEFRAILRNSTPTEILITFLLFAVLIVSVLAHFRLYQCGLDGRGCFMTDGGLLLLYLGSASGWGVLGWVFWEHLKARSNPNAL